MDMQANLGSEKVAGLDTKLQEILDLMGNTCDAAQLDKDGFINYDKLNQTRRSFVSEYELDGEKYFTPKTSDQTSSFSSNLSSQLSDFDVEKVEKESLCQKILDAAKNFKPSERTDQFRSSENSVAKDGGFALDDPVLLAKFRSALKDLIK